MSDALASAALARQLSTPQWLLQGELALCPCGCIGKRKKGSFVDKTLRGGSELIRRVMFAEDVAAQHGLLQRVDPRVKIIGLFGMLVAAALLHNILALVGLYLVALVLAGSSKIQLGFFVKRVWLFIPIFTLIVVAPATLSIITPGDVVLQLWTWHGSAEGFTMQGLTSAGLVVSRVAVSISLVVLLTLTTPWTRLLAALRSIGVPRMFIMVIGMAYRFIFLLLGTVTEMYESRRARTVGAQVHDKAARAFVASSAGAMFGKAHHLSDEVHQAMIARGYRGDAKTIQSFQLAAFDVAFLAASCVVCLLVIWGDRLLGR